MANKIYMTSGKGGSGVTTCALYLGRALAEAGERTLVIDGDRLAAGGIYAAGLAGKQTYTLADCEKGACRARQAVVSVAGQPNFFVAGTLGLKDENAAAEAVEELDGIFDYIICDKICAGACDGAFIVTEPYAAAIKSADVCADTLAGEGFEEPQLIVNKLNGGQIIEGEVMTAQEIAALLHVKLAAVIPEDLLLPTGKIKNFTRKAFRTAAERITGKGDGLCNVLKNYFGPAGYVRRKLRARI